jgi:hypothetical protein
MSDYFVYCDILIHFVYTVNSQLSGFQASGIIIQPENTRVIQKVKTVWLLQKINE